jgi:MoCo/4Fe-4S cofactor protein with predicted Tat translocation signal
MSLVNIKGSNPVTGLVSGAKYWRSLDQLAETPEFREWVGKEFPGGTEMLDGQSRRNVLKLMAASFGLALFQRRRGPDPRAGVFLQYSDIAGRTGDRASSRDT